MMYILDVHEKAWADQTEEMWFSAIFILNGMKENGILTDEQISIFYMALRKHLKEGHDWSEDELESRELNK